MRSADPILGADLGVFLLEEVAGHSLPVPKLTDLFKKNI